MSARAAALRSAAGAVGELLERVPDWSAPVSRMEGPVRGVVEHIASCLVWYTHDLVAGPTESPGPVPSWPAEATGEQLRHELAVAAEVLARVVDAATPDERGWHPWGIAGPTGFAAIGAAELLLHGDDVADGLGLVWRPPDDAVALVLGRLFPEAQGDEQPWQLLLWATGRGELPGRSPVGKWRYAMDVHAS